MLLEDEHGIRFRHQLLFEYVAARALVERGGVAELRRLAGIVATSPLDLFRGAVFEQAMIYAWDEHPAQRRGLAEVLGMLTRSQSANLQSTALVVAAHHPEVPADISGLLDRADPDTVSRFVELTPRVGGQKVGQVLELLDRVWDRGDSGSYRAVLNALERFAVPHPLAVKDFIDRKRCGEVIIALDEDMLLREHALPRTLGLLARVSGTWSAERLLALFKAACARARNRQLAVIILDIVAQQWAHLGSARCLALFVRAICHAQEGNGGQAAQPMRVAGGRIFAAYWMSRYRLGELGPAPGTSPRTEEWHTLVSHLRRRLAADPKVPLRVSMRLVGIALVLASLPEGHPITEPTLVKIFPPADDAYGLAMTKLPEGFLVPLLISDSPAGDSTRALIRQALARLPADPANTGDPASLRAIVARLAVTAANLAPSKLAALLDGVPSLCEPEQWIHPFGAIRWVVPAALGGHQVARSALAKIAAEPAQVGKNGRVEVTYALKDAIGQHPELIPQALAICSGWHTAMPFFEVARRYREEFTDHLTNYRFELDKLVSDLFARGGEAQQDAMNLWLEIDSLGILAHRTFAEMYSCWRSGHVLTARQNILRLMGKQAARGALSVDEVAGLMLSLVSVDRTGLRPAASDHADGATDMGTLDAARDALVVALASRGPLTS